MNPKKVARQDEDRQEQNSAEEPGLSLDEQRAFLRQMRMRNSQIPPKFADKTLKGFETRGSETRKQLVLMARDFVESYGKPISKDRPGAILHGAAGSGKTHILSAMLGELMDRGHRVLFYGVPDLFKEIRATFDGDARMDEDELLNEVARVEILALDDLGAEKSSEWVLDRLYWIINERYNNSLPTLITTNHDWPDDLEKAVGKRITSRLAEMCRVIGPFPSEDWRMKSAGLKRRLT